MRLPRAVGGEFWAAAAPARSGGAGRSAVALRARAGCNGPARSRVDTFRALRGAAERLACDVVTEVEPRPGGQASAVFVFAAVIGLARACAYCRACGRRARRRDPAGGRLWAEETVRGLDIIAFNPVKFRHRYRRPRAPVGGHQRRGASWLDHTARTLMSPAASLPRRALLRLLGAALALAFLPAAPMASAAAPVDPVLRRDRRAQARSGRVQRRDRQTRRWSPWSTACSRPTTRSGGERQGVTKPETFRLATGPSGRLGGPLFVRPVDRRP